MYITLKSIKRNLGLFNLEIEDIIVGVIFAVIFLIFFLFKLYTISFVILAHGLFALIPMDFSKENRMYKLFSLFFKFMFKNRNYYFYKD